MIRAGSRHLPQWRAGAGSRHLPQWRVGLSSIAFQMLQNQSQLNIDRVIDESRPYMTRSISRKVEELSIVSRAARSLGE